MPRVEGLMQKRTRGCDAEADHRRLSLKVVERLVVKDLWNRNRKDDRFSVVVIVVAVNVAVVVIVGWTPQL